MKKNALRVRSIVLFIVGGYLTYLVYRYLLPFSEQNRINLISLYGTYLSLYGIGLAYLQIVSVRQLSEATEQAAQNSYNATKRLVSIGELSKYKKSIEEIQGYLIQSNFSSATMRMGDLKENLIQNRYVPQLLKQTETKTYRAIVTSVGVHINTLHQKLINNNITIDLAIILADLEKAKSTIIEFENKLKSR